MLDENASKSRNFFDHAMKVARRQAAKAGCSTVMGFLKIATYKALTSGSNCTHSPAPGRDVPIVAVDTLNSQAAYEAIAESRCDLVCLMGTRILTKKTLATIGCLVINIRSGDPRFMRGAPTVVWEILAGLDAITLTIHRVIPELDARIEFCGRLAAQTMVNAMAVVTDLFLETIQGRAGCGANV
jgi:hypothetical protein